MVRRARVDEGTALSSARLQMRNGRAGTSLEIFRQPVDVTRLPLREPTASEYDCGIEESQAPP